MKKSKKNASLRNMEANFPKLEEKILKYWKQRRAFEQSLKLRKKAHRFVFYEGPPTANGRPGMHHVLARAFKDVVCRYKTMQGFYVERKAGWDTHGLPVELEVEKKLGLKSKRDIEEYGVGKFNKECKKSVWQYKKEWEDLTERIGFWLDQENPYITYEKRYMESLWWIIKQFWQRGLLYKGHKVVPYCPRCGTALSSHEVAQGYNTTKDRSVFVKFLISNSKFLNKSKTPNSKTYLLAWTTTPWTLPGNVALAVGEKITYVFVKQGVETYVLAKNLLAKLEGEYKVIKEVLGKELEGIEYEPLFDSLKKQPEKKYYVVAADFVSTEEGTGIVHTAVMYGEDDYLLGQQFDLPKVHTVDEEGKFNSLVSKWRGIFVKDAESAIIEDLRKRNLLLKEELYEHEYPFCWRCSTPLLYYAKDSWFIDMQKVKKELIQNNQEVNWIPPHIKTGRMGEWLNEVKDWAFSRERYWGTPLPVWICDKCDHQEVIGSIDDLKKQKFSDNVYYLLRHGHSDKQILGIVSSWPEKKPTSLTAKGRMQIKKAVHELKSKKIDLIFASDLLRTKQTAEIVGKELGIKPTYDKRIRENSPGIFNGQKIEKVGAFYRREGETMAEHYMRRFEIRPPKGENWVDVQKRLHDFIQDTEKKHQGKHILVVSHGLPLVLFEELLMGWTRKETVERLAKKGRPTLMEVGEWKKVSATQLPYNEDMEVDLHRPYIDEVKFSCNKCKQGVMKRVKEVVDVWFDSGSMPFAQQHYPFENKKEIDKGDQFPADYIVEAIDQTRGWFYTLLAISTLLGMKAPYKNVISLGHLLDEKGEKMSKSKGNVISPWEMIDAYGVDTLRWYFYTINHPWDSKLFAEKDLQGVMRKFMLTLWNSFVFYKTYRTAKNSKQGVKSSKNILDRWIVSRLNSVMKEMTKRLDEYDITGGARILEDFVVNDVSLWYVRRSRARFQNPHLRQGYGKQDFQEAVFTLGYVLESISKLSAPFIPFLSEFLYQEIRRTDKESVHWQDWPKANAKLIDTKLENDMRVVRDIVAKGLAERARAGIRVRQPLQKLKIKRSKSNINKEMIWLRGT